MRLSCGRTGSCHGNAVAESFFSSLKNEMCCQQKFATCADAKHAAIDCIERYCNRFRPHTTIDGQVPAKKTASFFDRAARVVEFDVGSV